jgi:hypothetical protein
MYPSLISVVVDVRRIGELPDKQSRTLEKDVEDFITLVGKLPRCACLVECITISEKGVLGLSIFTSRVLAA